MAASASRPRLISQRGDYCTAKIRIAKLTKGERDTYLRKEEHASSKDEGPHKLEGNRNLVRRSVVLVFGSVVDDGGNKESDGDSPLICRHNGTTNPFGRAGSQFQHT